MATTRAFATTVHDPDSRLVELLRRHADAVRASSAVAVAAVTRQTAEATVEALQGAGITLVVENERGVGQARRTAVRAAIEAGATSVLYCDLDRWLHWREFWPQELADLPARLEGSRPAPLYACLGRTTRAFGTHPKVQVACEDATNRAVSASFRRRCDVTAGAAWLSAEGARLVLDASVEPSNATDGEWPAIIWRHDSRRVLQTWCEGLEFETATFFQSEVEAAGGRDAWVRQTYDTAEAWASRLTLASATVNAFVRVMSAPTTA